MHDAFFERTVVLLWHKDDDGAAGIVINRPLSHALSDVLDDVTDYAGAEVLWGGPVDRTRGTVVCQAPVPEDSGWVLRDGLSVTTAMEALRDLIDDQERLLLCLGYTGWGAGQLDQEIETGSWLYTDATDELVFETPRHELYDRALATLGLTPSTVWMSPGEA
jgi:putative transcriptional regulator